MGLEQEADFVAKMDSVMDIFRRTEMNSVSKEVLQRMNNAAVMAVPKDAEYWKQAFYSGAGEPDDKLAKKNKREILSNILTDKAIEKVARKSIKIANKGASLDQVKSIVEESAWNAKARLFSNFKTLNEGIMSSIEYRIPPSEIIEKVKDKLFVKEENLMDNMRKKFLQEKIDLFFKLVRDLKEIEKVQVIKTAKCDIIRDSIHFRYEYLEKEEIRINEMKQKGTVTLNLTTMDQLPGDASSQKAYQRRSTIKRKLAGDSLPEV